MKRRTKIVATLGPATETPETLDRLLGAGVDCVRINCSHGTQDEQRARCEAARAAAKRAGRPLGVLFDLQGPKLRLSGDTEARTVRPGETLTFGAEGTDLVVDFPGFAQLATEQSEIVLGDGLPRFSVAAIEDDRIRATVVTGGAIGPRKGVNVTYARPNLPALTDKDLADLALAAEMDADFVALSFVRSATDVEDLRDRLLERGSKARTIAKIEKIEAYEHLAEILAIADGIMVARGDYGVEAGVARVPLMQKDAIYQATQHGKLVITATQMLESMIHAAEPTRAEAADVANAVIDGTSAVMLSAETGVGEYPVEAVRAMAEIAEAAEASPVIHGRCVRADHDSDAAAVLHAAVELADDLDVAALVIPSATGGGARACAKYRTSRPIVALVHDTRVANQLALEWGVRVGMMDVADNVDDLVEDALVCAREVAGLESGDSVVLTAGRRTGTPGATSLIMVREVPVVSERKKGFWGRVTTGLDPPAEGSVRRRLFDRLARLNVVTYRATGGRVGGSFDGAPVRILHHRGAKSGEPRETPLVFGTDGDQVVLIASMGGQPKNPAWYHNLVANPDVEIERRGKRVPMRARQVEGLERERMWSLMTGVYPGYDDYQARTRRQIPVMVCAPR